MQSPSIQSQAGPRRVSRLGSDASSLTNTTQYDGWGRVIFTVAPNSAQVNTAYDAMSRVISRTNPFQSGGTA
ncbi:MAG: hypothetical protein AABO57_28200, partial [Acidobacteriota bacterium]